MKTLIDRWCDVSPLARCLCGLLMLALAAMVFGFQRHQEEPKGPSKELAFQWRKLIPLRGEVMLQPPFELKPFSAMAFQSEGSQLVSWQPHAKGGELVLDARWDALLRSFDLLTEQGMSVKAFSVVPGGQHLQVTLQLEADGAN